MPSLCTRQGRVLAREARWLAHFWERGRGWIARPANPQLALAVPLVEGERIHTFGVRFPLDLAYCDAAGLVLHRATLAPRRIGPCVPGAVVVWELTAGSLSGVLIGEVLTCQSP